MKKLFAVTALLLLTCMLFSCGANFKNRDDNSPVGNKMTQLKDNEALYVESVAIPFVNTVNEVEAITTLTYTESIVYTLNRAYSSYSVPTQDHVEYDGYYYYWTADYNSVEETVGTKTTTTTTIYSYLPFDQNKSIAVKADVHITTKFDYEGGWITKPIDVTYNFNGYFTDLGSIKEASLELYNLVDHATEKRYYIDTTSGIETKASFTNSYDGYYYFEER